MSPVSPAFHTVESVRLPFNSKNIKAPSPASIKAIQDTCLKVP